ncbi:hypothetical protein [Streptomyces triticagri]|uniref:hypothetical protein n=1 Tax=Streptomyces triticagri TaxID=2293568 RepID=UPI001314F7C3|nr:hypothetical protein [Streptomyces triticagri]
MALESTPELVQLTAHDVTPEPLKESLRRLPRAANTDDWYADVRAARELLTEDRDAWDD